MFSNFKIGVRLVAGSSVDLAEKAGRLLDQMLPNIKKASDLVQEITAALRPTQWLGKLAAKNAGRGTGLAPGMAFAAAGAETPDESEFARF